MPWSELWPPERRAPRQLGGGVVGGRQGFVSLAEGRRDKDYKIDWIYPVKIDPTDLNGKVYHNPRV